MVIRPQQLDFLMMRKQILLSEIEELIKSDSLFQEIRKAAGEDFSMKSLLKNILGTDSPETSTDLHEKIASISIEAAQKFKQLLETCRSIRAYENPLIIY